MRHFFYCVLLIHCLNTAAAQSPSRVVFQRMVDACERNRSGQFVLHSKERLQNGKFIDSQMRVKYQTSPKKVYLHCIDPHAGTEVLFRQGWLENKLYINPSGFPYMNLKLSPFNSMVRKDSHHTVYQIGFDYIASMIRYYSAKHGERFYRYLQLKDTVQFENKKCIHLQFEFREFQQLSYTVKAGETITSIAEQFHLNDYSILLLNPDIDDFDDVSAGQKIRIPNFYNRRVDFYVDMVTWLPLVQEVYDAKGLYERYELRDFVNDPSFASDEFSPEYTGYTF